MFLLAINIITHHFHIAFIVKHYDPFKIFNPLCEKCLPVPRPVNETSEG